MKNVYNHDPVPLDPKGKIREIVFKALTQPDRYVDKLNLGCGTDYIGDYINVDGDRNIKADIYVELDDPNVHIPLPDKSIDFIYCSHILEHIWNLPQLKKELIRILRPSGLIVVLVPHYLSYDAWGDDTHCRAFSTASFSKGFWPGCETRAVQELKIEAEKMENVRTWILAIMEKV